MSKEKEHKRKWGYPVIAGVSVLGVGLLGYGGAGVYEMVTGQQVLPSFVSTVPGSDAAGGADRAQSATAEAGKNAAAAAGSSQPVPAVEYESVEVSPEGLTLYTLGEDQLPVTYDEGSGNFVAYADVPARTFTEAESKCDLTAKNEVDLSGQATVWSIPSIGASTGYTQTNFQLPATVDAQGRYGTWKSDTAPLFSDSGAGFYAGHVNMTDGSRSAWGKLHQIAPCAHKYITDETGAQREYVAVSLTLVANPSDIEKNGEYWRLDGQNAIYDVTCAGKYGVGDDGQSQMGGSLFASFPYRIVVKYLPVQ